MRSDPPVQNTHRVLNAEMELGGNLLKAGQSVLLVLAAANRDPAVFARPDHFDAARANNGEHLTFGAGIHLCAARHFSVALAADALMALFDSGRRVELLQREIAYESIANIRLPTQLMLAIH